MKKMLLTTIFAMIFLLSSSNFFGAYTATGEAYVSPGGSYTKGTSYNPSKCRARGKTPYSYNDTIKVTLYDLDDNIDWGVPVNLSGTAKNLYYNTSFSTTSCEAWDGAKTYNKNNHTNITVNSQYEYY